MQAYSSVVVLTFFLGGGWFIIKRFVYINDHDKSSDSYCPKETEKVIFYLAMALIPPLGSLSFWHWWNRVDDDFDDDDKDKFYCVYC